jgi:enoyl-CoA hydratase/carnithine racemase
MDISRLTRSTTDPTYVRPVRRPQTYALGVPKPIVAAVDGACAGIGFVQALMCDLRFTTARSKWTTSFVRRALNVEDAVSWLLPRLVGTARAADLILSARVVRGDEAARIGLVNEVVEPDELLPAALAWASDVARSCAPWSLAKAKEQLLRDLHGGLEEARLRANEALDEARDRDDYREGVASFTERRPPRFAGLDPAFGRLDVPGATPA